MNRAILTITNYLPRTAAREKVGISFYFDRAGLLPKSSEKVDHLLLLLFSRAMVGYICVPQK